MLVVVALVAAACGADDPLDQDVIALAADGTPLCELRAPDAADLEAPAAGEDHDEADAAPEEAGEAGHDEAPAAGEDHDEADAAPEEAGEAGHDEAPAAGEDHDEAPGMDDVDFVVDIEMSEFAYSCALPMIDQGTTLALRFDNVGTAEHEAVVGSLDQQHDAEVEMAEMAEMDAGHDEVGGGHSVPAITLPAGEAQTMIVEFDEPGSFWVGCHVPGHWDAGMRNEFTVARA
jgi:uncharacterized cupredoxin-like copper-binding protein